MCSSINSFKYSNTNKRYHTFDYYLKQRYGCKVAKINLDGGFTCPNRDGTIGTNGCIFCSSMNHDSDNLLIQFNKYKKLIDAKWKNCKYIAYFNSYTNTYDDLIKLKNKYELFINQENVVALAIATRADCLNDEILDYLAELNKKIDLWVEIGLQTTNDNTAKLINRGYDYNVFIKCLDKLNHRNINTCIHLINGLPNETESMMLENITKLNQLNIQAIKIHSLLVLENTELANMYYNKEFIPLEREKYIDIVVKQLELLKSEIIIQRLTADVSGDSLIAPLWTKNKTTILNDIDKLLVTKNSYQGIKVK